MKKGHRRTNSQTITLSRQIQEKPLSKKESAQEYHFHPIQPTSLSHKNTFPTIESLIEKSQHNITERILYIQNLQQPTSQQNTLSEFSFGKGLNYKLNNFKLAMNSIPQVPKSNESTSLQGQNKLQILEKQLYFTHQPYKTKQFSNEDKKQHKVIKFPNTKHMKTSSAVSDKHNKEKHPKSSQVNVLRPNHSQKANCLNLSEQYDLELTQEKEEKTLVSNKVMFVSIKKHKILSVVHDFSIFSFSFFYFRSIAIVQGSMIKTWQQFIK